MARYRRRNAGGVGPIIILFIVGGIVYAAQQIDSNPEALEGVAVLAAIAVMLVVLWILRRERMKKAIAKKIASIISTHIEALARRRRQLVTQDAYGSLVMDRWRKEIDNFIATQIIPKALEEEMSLLRKELPGLPAVIDLKVRDYISKTPIKLEFREGMTPSEFESYCADILRACGWDARVTMASRDQGVDVIAERNGLRLVVQCKLYGRSVGNKAVQEITAGRAHENAAYAAVVSNNRFTESAAQLAQTNNVFLLHYSELEKINDRVGLSVWGRKI